MTKNKRVIEQREIQLNFLITKTAEQMHHFLSLITVHWLLITPPWKFYNFDAVFLKMTRDGQCKPPELCFLSPLVTDTCRKQPWITPVPAAPGSLRHRPWGERWNRAGIPWPGSKRRSDWEGCLHGLLCAGSLRHLENKTVMNRCSEHTSRRHAGHWGFYATQIAYRVFNQNVSN